MVSIIDFMSKFDFIAEVSHLGNVTQRRIIIGGFGMSENIALSSLSTSTVPLMTPVAYAQVAGIEFSVFQAQMYRGYWPTVKVGKRVFINVEAVRLQAAQEYLDKYSA